MSNLWRRFASLLPTDPLQIATVQTLNADGTSTVQSPAGGLVVVRGQGVAIGQKAFIRYGRIEGEAPDLPVYEFEV